MGKIKDTYTNLNYDLMMTDNITVENSTREELFSYAKILLHDAYYQDFLYNLSLLQMDDSYYNWYHGYSMIKIPFYSKAQRRFEYQIYTVASSGSVTTKYFGQKYDPNKVSTPVDYRFELGNKKVYFLCKK